MKKFKISIRETHIREVEVFAEDRAGALEAYADGQYSFCGLEFEDDGNPDTWEVLEEKG